MTSRAIKVIGTVAVAVTTVALAGCGSGQVLSARQLTTLELRRDVSALAEAVAAHNPAGANSAMTVLKDAATRAHASHVIDDATFGRIVAAAAHVQADLAAPPASTPSGSAHTSATTPTPLPPKPKSTPTVSPAQPAKGKHHGTGHGHGGEGDG